MAQSLSEKDIQDLVGAMSGVSSRTAKRVLNNLKLIIVSELQNNERITLRGIGTFRLSHKGGKDEWIVNSLGLKEKQYIEEYDFADFSPSQAFLDAINGDARVINRANTIKYKEASTALSEDDYISQLATPTVLEVVHTLIDRKLAKIDDGDPYRYNRIRCLNNDKVYDTPHQACMDLQLSMNKMYARVKKQETPFEIDGFKFEWVDKTGKIIKERKKKRNDK